MLQQALANTLLSPAPPVLSSISAAIPIRKPFLPRHLDLRRRRRADLAEVIAERAIWLPPEDRALLIAIYQERLSIRAVALLRARAESPARIRAHIRRLAAHITSPLFLFVLRERDAWPALRRRIATACILNRRTMRAASIHLNLSLHRVRHEMHSITTLFETRES